MRVTEKICQVIEKKKKKHHNRMPQRKTRCGHATRMCMLFELGNSESSELVSDVDIAQIHDHDAILNLPW